MRQNPSPASPRTLVVGLLALAALAVSLQPQAQDSREITTATLNWEPFYGEDLERNGFFTAITNAAFERAGYAVDNDFIPWARAMKDTHDGYRDVLQGAYYSDERAEEYYVSDVVYEAEVGLVARPEIDIRRYDDMGDLEGYTIAVGRGFAHSDEFDEAEFLDKQPVDDHPELAVRQLFAGRIDMIAGGIPAILHEVTEQGHRVDDVVVITPPLVVNPLHNMVSHNHPRGEQIIADFNRGLRAIREDGTYDRILVEMGFLDPEEADAGDVAEAE